MLTLCLPNTLPSWRSKSISVGKAKARRQAGSQELQHHQFALRDDSLIMLIYCKFWLFLWQKYAMNILASIQLYAENILNCLFFARYLYLLLLLWLQLFFAFLLFPFGRCNEVREFKYLGALALTYIETRKNRAHTSQSLGWSVKLPIKLSIAFINK